MSGCSGNPLSADFVPINSPGHVLAILSARPAQSLLARKPEGCRGQTGFAFKKALEVLRVVKAQLKRYLVHGE